MREIDSMSKKIVTIEQAKSILYGWKLLGKTCAFTNGCFDILHKGHLFSLGQAAKEADYLIVGLNSDASIQKIKGPTRPINNSESRALLLCNLAIVDLVIVFEEESPLILLKELLPDFLVKGGDYTLDQIVGAKEVIEAGGKVIINPIIAGYSTTSLIEKIKK